MNKIESYIYGLLITDGSLYLTTRNRGKVILEVSEKDEDIIQKLYNVIPNSGIHERVRNTNFKNNYKTKIFTNHRKEFRDKLISFGFPKSDKTQNASIPIVEYDEYSFWRGVIDGDGSIGFTKSKNCEPFISLVTKSESLKEEFLKFLNRELNINKKVNRNKRDKVYNITIKNEDAVELAKKLYLDLENDLYINRKYTKAVEIQNWKRTVPKRTK